jgi:plastocyanin
MLQKFVIVILLASSICVVMPLAFADTRQVVIMPGTGTSNNCSYTETCTNPSILSISPGDSVTWTNSDNVAHSVVSGLPYATQTGTVFDSGIIPPGTTYSFTFQDVGTYKYFDRVDKWVVGEVIVVSTLPSPTVPEFGTLVGLTIVTSIIGVIVLTRTFMKS